MKMHLDNEIFDITNLFYNLFRKIEHLSNLKSYSPHFSKRKKT
jgi:hypothetical protein